MSNSLVKLSDNTESGIFLYILHAQMVQIVLQLSVCYFFPDVCIFSCTYQGSTLL